LEYVYIGVLNLVYWIELSGNKADYTLPIRHILHFVSWITFKRNIKQLQHFKYISELDTTQDMSNSANSIQSLYMT